MKYEYELKLSTDLGNVLTPVGEMLKHLNDEMTSLGWDEKLTIRSQCLSATVTAERELTDEDKDTMKKMLIEQFNASQPAWKVQVESFCRKSCNVQQSVWFRNRNEQRLKPEMLHLRGAHGTKTRNKT